MLISNSLQESKFPKNWLFDMLPIVDWLASTVLSFWRISLITAFSSFIGRSSSWPSTDCFAPPAHR
jgi:hypothetical protein